MLAGWMTFVMTACGNGVLDNVMSGSSSKREGSLIKVGIINNKPDESGYREANNRDMQKMFTAENGYAAEFIYCETNDKQIRAAQKYIQDGKDYILISAADAKGWDTVLQTAFDAGVHVILFDRLVDVNAQLYDSAVVSDMEKEGDLAVQWLEGQKLDRYRILHLQGRKGSAAQLGRTLPLQRKVDSEDKWDIIRQEAANWNEVEAREIVEKVIASGTSFNVVYAENDNMAKGAAVALDAAGITHGVGKDVVIMAFDCNKWALKALLNQEWNYDGQCNPFQASYVDKVIRQIESGKKPEKKVFLDEVGFDAKTITVEDVEKFGI